MAQPLEDQPPYGFQRASLPLLSVLDPNKNDKHDTPKTIAFIKATSGTTILLQEWVGSS